MAADLSPRWVTPHKIAELAHELREFHGYRALWLDDELRIWHTEPEDLLEEQGLRYLGACLRPSYDELEAMLLGSQTRAA